ncbi:MAG TPA: 50S ribosomal protein L17 [Candidatus Eisenbacteria bacterium]|jgi:large subunit ribosomal protein L17|nr:50S ribosomal protein L17 [Candidatus Eisenbacteria bacterium]
MRHRKDHRKLSRTHSHRKALLRNLVTSLFIHERIETTVAKAKEARRLGERMITFAKRGDIPARRHVARFVHGDDVVRKLFDTVAPWYAERNGGYTRIVRIGRRLGDAGETALLELVKSPELKEKLRKDAEDAAKAAKAAEKKGGAAKVAKGKAGEAAAAKGGEGEAAAEGGSPKEKRSAKPARGEKFGKKGVPTQHKPTTRARQRGKSGD